MHAEPSTVRKVSGISTGSVPLHPEHIYGTSKPATLLVNDEQWDHLLGSDLARETVPRRDVLRAGVSWCNYEFETTSDQRLAPFTEAKG